MKNKKWINFGNGAVNFITKLISICLILGLLVLTVNAYNGSVSIVYTEKIHSFIQYRYDSLVLNCICTCLLLIILYYSRKTFLNKSKPEYLLIAMCAIWLIFGNIWIFSVTSLPMTDSKVLLDTSTELLNGDLSHFQKNDDPYFYYYPFQLGMLALYQLFNIFFKGYALYFSLQELNLVSLCACVVGFYLILCEYKSSKLLKNTYLFIAFSMIPAVFFVTFIYANYTGFAFGIFSILFALKFIRTGKFRYIAISAMLIGFSIAIKSNDMIILMAMCIIFLLEFLKSWKLRNLAAIAICGICGIGFIRIIIYIYRICTGIDLGSGMPQIMWADIGTHVSPYNGGCGWWTREHGIGVYKACGYDSKATTAAGLSEISSQLLNFIKHPSIGIDFYKKKILSQWNDSTMSAIWLSKSHDHYIEPNKFANAIYYGTFGKMLNFFMDRYQEMIYLLCLFTSFALYKEKNIQKFVIPTIIIGGIAYHTLFEAKTQYAMTYYIAMAFAASISADKILTREKARKISRLIK